MARQQTGGRRRAVAFLGLSLAAALGAAGVVGNLLLTWGDAVEAAAQRDLYPVVTVVAEVPAGAALTADDLGVMDVEVEFAPDGTFQDREMAIGRVARERLVPGELLRSERLAPPGARPGLGALIPQGMRAVGVSVNHSTAVDGFLEPGNHVDVVLTVSDEQNKRTVHTQTVLQAMRVLAIEDHFVTLAATPADAAVLAHGQSEGELTLTLRNERDLGTLEFEGASSRR